MIIISLLGVDQFQSEELVKAIHVPVAQIFETDPEDIVFYAPDSFLIYKGVEQTSYQLVIEVEAPSKYIPLEAKAADLLIKLFSESHVHVRVLFKYFDAKHEYEYVNNEYPRFMTDDNVLRMDDLYNGNEEPYMGNAFENYEERVREREQEQVREEAQKHNHTCSHDHNHD